MSLIWWFVIMFIVLIVILRIKNSMRNEGVDIISQANKKSFIGECCGKIGKRLFGA